MKEKRCSMCERTRPLEKFGPRYCGRSGYRSECNDCYKAYRRLRRAQGKDKTRGKTTKKPDPVKNRARKLLRYQVSLGNVERGPCEVCAEPKTHGHHDDYSRPLEVRWLCAVHHAAEHATQIDSPLMEEVERARQGG